MKVELYEHQKKVLEITKGRNRVAYYLDMGLGKTFVATEKMKQLDEKLNVIVCQKSKINDWVEHLKTYYGDYEIVKYNTQDLSNFNNKTVLVINYDLIWRRPQFKTIKDFTLILDESSYIKNDQATRTKFILKLKFKNIILLSGTPVAGKYEELYSQLKLLGYTKNKSVYFSTYMVTKKFKLGGVLIQR